MRLIDADALKELFSEVIGRIAIKPEMNGNLEHMIRASAMVIQMIDDAPTVQLGTNLAEVGTDLVSRQAVKDIFTELYGISAIGSVFDKYEWADICETTANELPSIQPNHCAEVGKKVLIDRQEALEIIRKMQTYKLFAGDDMLLIDQAEAQTELMMLPPAQPEHKTGRWIKTARWGRVYYCNQCRNYLDFDGVNAGRGSTNFCPNCGADMRGEKK